MLAQSIAILILLPFASVFVYAGVHEYQRYRSEGSAKYGLVYDPESGTTHVSGIAEDDDGYDPDGFDPSENRDRVSAKDTDTGSA
jgi:hypothetical protein